MKTSEIVLSNELRVTDDWSSSPQLRATHPPSARDVVETPLTSWAHLWDVGGSESPEKNPKTWGEGAYLATQRLCCVSFSSAS